jgi:hypothetical protein
MNGPGNVPCERTPEVTAWSVDGQFRIGMRGRCGKRVARGWGSRGRSLVLLVCVALLIPPAGLGQKMSIVTIRMAIDPGHEMVGVPCQINGVQRRYICVIDSGATYTVVSDRVVKAEGPTIEMTTGNGVVRVHRREVSLTIAKGLELKSQALVQTRMLEGVDVLLGQDVLRQFKYVTFDFENLQVEFQR